MQWRSAWAGRVITPMLVAMIAAGCEENTANLIGPRIATLIVASGDGQSGPVGGLLPLPVVARVEDQRGAGVAGAEVAWVIVSGTGSVTSALDTTDADGNVETLVRLGPEVGIQTVAAQIPNVSPAVFNLNATTGLASRVEADSGDAQTGAVGAALTDVIVARVTDAFGNPKAGVPVTFTVSVGGGTVSASTVVSDAQGHSRTRWTLGTAAGTQSISATAGTLAGATFTATATPDAPSQFVVLSGGNQIAAPGATLTDSIIVRLVDQFGNPVGGVSVDWVPDAGSGSVNPTTTSTNASGRTGTRWTLGGTGGPMSLTIRAGSVNGTVGGAAFVAFDNLSAGGRNTCAVDVGGVLYCWGFNGDGQLGIGVGPAGSGPIFAVPQAVPPVGGQTFASIAGGLFHNCAVTLSHIGYCWGDNNNGQVGAGSNNRSVNQPTNVAVSIPFASVSSGRVHSCGISIGGRGYCWGSNERGQLGANIAIDTTTVPGSTLVTFHSNNAPQELGSPNGGGTYFFGPWDWSAIAAGGVHTCAIRQGGAAYCWGLGREGQLGNGTNSVNEYLPQLVAGGTAYTAITAGYKHSCARGLNGAVQCWGDNSSGQLGNGGAGTSNTPVNVGGGFAFASVSAGYAHTCGVTSAGDVYCWGDNTYGQLGNGSVTASSGPVPVAGGLLFRSITAGDNHTCGVTTSGVAYCWGDNEYGTIGDGTGTNRATPVKVRFQQ